MLAVSGWRGGAWKPPQSGLRDAPLCIRCECFFIFSSKPGGTWPCVKAESWAKDLVCRDCWWSTEHIPSPVKRGGKGQDCRKGRRALHAVGL